MRAPLLLALVALGVFCMPGTLALNPPQWNQAREIAAALGYDPKIKATVMGSSGDTALVTVNVPSGANSMAKAQALATLLAPYAVKDPGFGKVSLIVKYGDDQAIPPKPLPTTADAALRLLKVALRDNTLYKRVATEQTPGGAWSFVIFRAGIVQWWTDNIGQWQGQTSEAAASVLSRVYGIDFLNLTEGQVNGSTEFCKNAPCK